jgi:hypothetical protein
MSTKQNINRIIIFMPMLPHSTLLYASSTVFAKNLGSCLEQLQDLQTLNLATK